MWALDRRGDLLGAADTTIYGCHVARLVEITGLPLIATNTSRLGGVFETAVFYVAPISKEVWPFL